MRADSSCRDVIPAGRFARARGISLDGSERLERPKPTTRSETGSAAHVHLGFGGFLEYTERLFGFRPRTTQEKLRVAESLETLPRLARALETGALSWCAVRELTRVWQWPRPSPPGSTPRAARPCASSRRWWRARPPETMATRAGRPARAQTTPTWTRRAGERATQPSRPTRPRRGEPPAPTSVRAAPDRASRRRCGAPCSRALDTAARCRAAPTRPSSTCTMSCHARKAVAMKRRTSWSCALRTIEPPIAASWSSTSSAIALSASCMAMALPTATR